MAGGMSGPLALRGRRRAARLAPTTSTRATPEAMPIRRALPDEMAATTLIGQAAPPTQNGPSGAGWMVFVPRGGPSKMVEVSTLTGDTVSVTLDRQRPRGPCPSPYSPSL